MNKLLRVFFAALVTLRFPIGLLVIVIVAYIYLGNDTEFVPVIRTATISQGDIVDAVGATGTLEAVTTVNVGSQVSGIIDELNVDFNSIVRKGEVIMRLNPSLFETQVEQGRANLVRAQADTERLRVSLDDAVTKLNRAENLAAKELISVTEFEAAQVTVRSTEAQLKSSEAAIIQAEASLNQNEVNLGHTIIKAPIDGIVISRLVDVGQTVAASLQAPELFVIAADLTKMRVIANIDESDVGRIRPDQRVTFSVDAFPNEEFEGSVTQVRLEPVITQNVVTYATVVDAPNLDLRLKPGMTATINLETARRENVLRIPNTALRFRPTNEIFKALGQSLPETDVLQGRSRQNRDSASNMPEKTETVETVGDELTTTERLGRGGPSNQDRRRQFQEQFGQMTQEQREQFEIRRSARRNENAGFTGSGRPGSSRARRSASESSSSTVPTVERGATTIDALFGALPVIETTGRVWILQGESLQQIDVRLGVSDGTLTELLEVLGEPMTAPTQSPFTSHQTALLRERIATIEDRTTRAALMQTIEEIESRSPTTTEPLGSPAQLKSLHAGTVLITNITSPDSDSSSSGATAGSPFIPQFGRRR